MFDMPGEPIIRQRATSASGRYGDDTPNWSEPDELAIDGCAIDPGGSTEENDGRTAVDTRPTIYAPPGADVAAGDRIVFRGGDPVEVDGKPAAWTDPFDATAVGVVIKLKGVEG